MIFGVVSIVDQNDSHYVEWLEAIAKFSATVEGNVYSTNCYSIKFSVIKFILIKPIFTLFINWSMLYFFAISSFP